MTRNPMRSRLLFLELSGDFGETSLQPDLFRFDRAIGSETRRCRKRRYSDDAVTSSSKRLACYQMNRRFDLSIIESFSEIPACRAREVLFLLIEVDPISGRSASNARKLIRRSIGRESRGSREIISGGRSLETSLSNSSRRPPQV